MAKGFVFANNLLLDTKQKFHRTDVVNEVAFQKLEHIVQHAEENDLVLVLVGQVFTRTFCVKTLSECIDRLGSVQCLILADNSQLENQSLNPRSTLGILDRAGIVSAIYGNEISKRICIETEGGEVDYGFFGNRSDVKNNEIYIDQGLFTDLTCIFLGDFEANLDYKQGSQGVKPYEVPGCGLVVASGTEQVFSESQVGKTVWLNPGLVVRQSKASEGTPGFSTYLPGKGIEVHDIPYEEYVFEESVSEEVTRSSIQKSNFAHKLYLECSDDTGDQLSVNKSIIDNLCKERSVTQSAREVIYNLERRYHASK